MSILKAPPTLRSPSAEPVPTKRASTAVKIEPSEKETPTKPGSAYPPIKSSTLDVDAKPVYEPAGKPITEADMDSGTFSHLRPCA